MSHIIALPLWAEWTVVASLTIVLGVATYTDLKNQKIRNKLTYPSIVLGLILSIPVFGIYGAVANAGAVIAVFVAGIILMIPGWMGGGDVKLLMAVGAFVGIEALYAVLVYTFFSGFFIGLSYAIYTNYIWKMLKNMWRMIRAVFRMIYYRTLNVSYGLEPTDDRSDIPFASAIGIGFLMAYSEFKVGWPNLIALLEQALSVPATN